MTFQLSPGPWHIDDDDGPIILDANNNRVAEVYYRRDAAAIVSVPDLLAALKTLVGHQSYDTLLKANKAIKKAEGRE